MKKALLIIVGIFVALCGQTLVQLLWKDKMYWHALGAFAVTVAFILVYRRVLYPVRKSS